jgi:hypothetical protein
MKKSFLSTLMAGLAVVAFTFSSCTTDPCKDVTCDNGGECVDGDCVCADGYEGTTCQTEQRAKFLGSFSVNEACNSGNYSYNSDVNTSSVSVSNIVITNFGDYSVSVAATVDANGTSVTIANQTVTISGASATVQGSGQISGNILTITYTISSGGVSDTCTMTCTKQ